jgi:hypothetical protein
MPENCGPCKITIRYTCVFCSHDMTATMDIEEFASTFQETGETDPPTTGPHIYCENCDSRNYFRMFGE